MKLLLLNQFFHPDLSATAQLATDLAEDLAARGHEVTVLAARGSYLGGGAWSARERHRGVEIVRVWSTSLGKASTARRLVDYLSFFAAAAWRAMTLPRPDLVLTLSTPPMVASIGAALRVLRGVPFVYWLQDVYPELAIEFGVLRRGGLRARLFGAASGWIQRRADAVVVLGRAMAERVKAHGVPAARVHVVPNWADGASLSPLLPAENGLRAELGLADKKVVLYSGNMGRAHDLATLLGAAQALRHRADVVFLFVGAGAKRHEVEAASAVNPSVRLLPYVPRERLRESLSCGDVHVVTQTAATVGLLEPSKLYGAMAVGRPVLFIGPAQGEAAATVERERIGVVVAPGDVAGAVSALERLLADTEFGPRARAAFERAYDRRARTRALGELLGSFARPD
jgi:glycosyltransferase involved in cell wall biosynthesis